MSLIDEVGLRVNEIQEKSKYTKRFKFEVSPIQNLVVGYQEEKVEFILYRYNTKQPHKFHLLYDFLYVEVDVDHARLVKVGKFNSFEIGSMVEQRSYFFDKNHKVTKALSESEEEKDGKVTNHQQVDIGTLNLGQDISSFSLVYKFRFEFKDDQVKVTEMAKV
jgi:hypothetical protein